jgi:hypothetical protein
MRMNKTRKRAALRLKAYRKMINNPGAVYPKSDERVIRLAIAGRCSMLPPEGIVVLTHSHLAPDPMVES